MSAGLRLARPGLQVASTPIVGGGLRRSLAARPAGPTLARSLARRPAVAAATFPVIGAPLAPGARAFSLWPWRKSKTPEATSTEATASGANTTVADSGSAAVGDAVGADAGSAAEAVAGQSESVQNAASGAAEALNKAGGEVAAGTEGAVEGMQQVLDAATPVVDMAAPASEFAQAGLPNGYLMVPYLQEMLEWITINTGAPWWAVIVGAPLVVRLLLFPLTVWGQKESIRLANVAPKMKGLMADYEYAKKANDQMLLQKAGSRLQTIMNANQITASTAFKAMVPSLIPMPVFITLFFAISGMAKAGLHSMTYGGFLWLPDLTLADPYLLVPIFTSACQLASMELSRVIDPKDENTQQRVMKNIFRAGLCISPLILRNWASGVLLLWASNAVLGTIQAMLLKNRMVIDYFKIPKRTIDTRPINLSEPKSSWVDKVKDKIVKGFSRSKDPESVARERQAQEKQRSLQKRRAALERLSPSNSSAASSGLSSPRTPRRSPSKKAP